MLSTDRAAHFNEQGLSRGVLGVCLNWATVTVEITPSLPGCPGAAGHNGHHLNLGIAWVASSPVHLSKHLIKRFGAVCPWISGHFCHKGEKSIQVTLGLPGVFNNDNCFRIMSTLKCVHVSPLDQNSNSNSKHLTFNVLHHKIKPYS